MKRIGDAAMIAAIAVLFGFLAIFSTASRADGDRSREQILADAMPAVTMVLAVERKGRQLIPISSGSGTIIESDGSILTNVHVLVDPTDKTPHDLFVIARYRSLDTEPELVCAGRPSLGKLNLALDLALIKCDLDMSLRPFTVQNWPTLAIGRSEEMIPGEQILVLGYPHIGGHAIGVSQGLLSGWMREGQGHTYRAYMKTDASITHGNSGGAAIDKAGLLVGVPTAFRVTTAKQGKITISAGKVGLIRPIEQARDLIAIARSGWMPSPDGRIPATTANSNEQHQQAQRGVQIRSRVVDTTNHQPIADATVVVFRHEISESTIDINDLEHQALTWGRSNADGAVRLAAPLARGASYTVAVFAKGFVPLIANSALVLSGDAPRQLNPWHRIGLEPR